MTIEEAQKLVDEWIKMYGVRYFDELTNTALLMEEVGELARIMARRFGEQSAKPSDTHLLTNEAIGDELADILFVVFCLANQTGINLSDSFRKNLAKKSDRDATRHLDNEKLRE